MDEAMQEANSSDFEQLLGEDDGYNDQFKPNPRRGKRIAEEIIRNQAIDRPLSKRNARQLTFVRGAPSTRAMIESVATAWDAFCETARLDKDTCPSGELILRFLDVRARRTTTSIPGKPAPSLSVIQRVWFALLKLLKFRHRDLSSKYTTYDVAHIETHLDQLVQRKLLVRGRWAKRQWLGFVVLEKMARAWVERALIEGCPSWDRVLLRLLGVVLQAACCARSGDIARSQYYDDLECLCWKNVELVLKKDAPLSVQSLRAKLTLEYTKGFKGTLGKDKVVFIDPLPDGSNVMCAVKLLMIIALRLGQVHGTTLKDVLLHTAERLDRTVQWTAPNAPVLCKFTVSACTLLLDKPAGQHRINHSLRAMGLVAGLLAPVTSHSIRNGGIRDTSHVKKVVAGVVNHATAAVAGHTNTALHKGITADYSGPFQETVYNARADVAFVDRLAPAFAPAPPAKLEKRLTKPDIDAYMVKQGMDLTDKKARQRASKAIKKEREQEWRATEKDRKVSDPVEERNPPGKKRRTTSMAGASPAKYFSQTQGDSSGTAQVPDELIDPRLNMPLPGIEEAESAEVDPSAFDRLVATVLNTSERDETTEMQGEEQRSANEGLEDEDIDGALADSLAAEDTALPDDERGAVRLAGDEFVAKFAVINVYKLAYHRKFDPEEVAKQQGAANSRDPPTRWLYYCDKGECVYSTPVLTSLQLHLAVCKGICKDDKPFPCEYEGGCGESFRTPEARRNHTMRKHTYTPQPCKQCPDKPDAVYETFDKLRKHRQDEHDPLDEPRKCPFADKCGNETLFTIRHKFQLHLRNVHIEKADDFHLYIDDKRKQKKRTLQEAEED